MQSGSRFLFRALCVSSTGLAAVMIGIACIVLINLAPTAIWGDGILIVSPYLTGIPSFVAAFFVSRWFFIHHMEWLDAGFPASQRSPSTPQLITSAITLAAGVAALYIAVNGLHPKFFELAWREEIRLGNGGLKVVETRRTYERLDFFRLSEFKNVRLQRTQLSFEPVAGEPRVSVSTALQPVYLNQMDGAWYLVLAGREGGLNAEQPKDEWGGDYNTLGQRLAILKGRRFEPAPWEKAPRSLVLRNLLSADIFDLAKAKAAEKHLMTLYEKQTLAYRYVNMPGPDPLRITRSEAMKTPLLEEYQEALAGLIKPP